MYFITLAPVTRRLSRYISVNDNCDSKIQFTFVVIDAKTLFMSQSGINNASCGTASLPCRTLQYTLNYRSTNNDSILIDGRNVNGTAEYLEEIPYPIFIACKLTLQGHHGTPIIKFSGTNTMMKIKAMNGIDAGITIKGISFRMNSSHSTIFSLSDASFFCSECTFQGEMTAIDFKWGIPVALTIRRSLFKGVIYGVKAQHSCAHGKLEISNSSFIGKRGVSYTGFQLTSGCFHYPYPDSNINLLIGMTNITDFSIGIGISASHITAFEVTIDKCNFRKHRRGAVLVAVGRQDNTHTKIKVNASSFLNNEADSGGALQIESCFNHPTNVEVNITKCRFERNRAKTIGGGVAVRGGMKFFAEYCHFAMNDCRDDVEMHYNYGQGSGGALGIDPMGNEINVIIQRCIFTNNEAYSFGGAIYAKGSSTKSHLLISNTMLKSVKNSKNPAIEGDIIYSAIDTKIVQVKSRIQPMYGSNAIHLTGQYGSKIDELSEFIVTVGYLFHLAAVPVQVFMSNRMLFDEKSGSAFGFQGAPSDKLPPDAQTNAKKRKQGKPISSSSDPKNKHKIATMYREFSLNVFSCPYNHYNLYESIFNNLTLTNSNCHKCPEGGICPYGKLKAKENFWGYLANHDQTVKFVRLIDNYGCKGNGCAAYNSCATDRTGQLCATCRPGFSENFLSTSCIPNSKCNTKMFWVTACVLVVVYISFFLYKKELLRYIKHHLLWFWQQNRDEKVVALTANYILFQHQEKTNANAQDQKEAYEIIQPDIQQPQNEATLSSFIKICFYFYQVESVLNMQVSDTELGIIKHLRHLMRNIFIFKFAANGSSSCFKSDATPVEKILLRLGLIGVILAVFVSLYTASLLIERLLLRRSNGKKFSNRILPTLFEVLLQGYAILVFATFKLIKCVDVNGKSYLYVQGTVQCYAYWQYLFIIVATAWVLPFCIIVFILPHCITKGRIRRSGLFVACVLPLSYIIYIIVGMVTSIVHRTNGRKSEQTNQDNKTMENRNNVGENSGECTRDNNGDYNGDYNGDNNGEYNEVNGNDKEKQENNSLHSDKALNSILAYMTDSFKKGSTEAQYLWWDGMLMLRKLTIISIASLIEHPYVKLYLLLLVQILFLMHHVHAKPFNSKAMNAIETVSLTLLTLFGSMRFIQATKDDSLTGASATLSKIFTWLNIISTSALPVVTCFVLVSLILIKIFHVTKVFTDLIASKLQ